MPIFCYTFGTKSVPLSIPLSIYICVPATHHTLYSFFVHNQRYWRCVRRMLFPPDLCASLYSADSSHPSIDHIHSELPALCSLQLSPLFRHFSQLEKVILKLPLSPQVLRFLIKLIFELAAFSSQIDFELPALVLIKASLLPRPFSLLSALSWRKLSPLPRLLSQL